MHKKRGISACFLLMFGLALKLVAQPQTLPFYKPSMDKLYPVDWLLGQHSAKANIYISAAGRYYFKQRPGNKNFSSSA